MISLAVLAGVVYFSVTVPLGNKTLWGHIKAIAGSRESKDLVKGVQDKAKTVISPDGGAKSQDRLTDDERKLLRKLIRDKLKGEGEKAEAPGAK